MMVNWRPCSGAECKAALENEGGVERVIRTEHCFETEGNRISLQTCLT
jgi:hypothetical protein